MSILQLRNSRKIREIEEEDEDEDGYPAVPADKRMTFQDEVKDSADMIPKSVADEQLAFRYEHSSSVHCGSSSSQDS